MEAEDLGCLRLYPSPGPNLEWKHDYEMLGEISKNAKYSLSLQAAIWRKDIFNEILVDGENGWDMEIKGSIRCQSISKTFISLKTKDNRFTDIPLSYIATAIVKGKWKKRAIDFLQQEGISIDYRKRGIYKPQPKLFKLLNKFIFKLSTFVPNK